MLSASTIVVSGLLAVVNGATAGVSTFGDFSSLQGRSLSGEATYYGGNTVGGTCSFSTYTIPTGLYGTALSSDNWDDAANCGRCITVTGPSGNSISAMITDQCPNCGTNHLDLYPDAFAALANPSKGIIDVTWGYIDCPITTPLFVHLKEGVSAYWFSIEVVNANKGVTSVEVSADSGSTWLATDRQTYNYFQISSGTGTTTVEVKITSIDGDVITISGVSVVAGVSAYASNNFPSSGSSTVASSAAVAASSTTSSAAILESSTTAAVEATTSTIVLSTTTEQVSTTAEQASTTAEQVSTTDLFPSSVSIATFPAVTESPTVTESIPPVSISTSAASSAAPVPQTTTAEETTFLTTHSVVTSTVLATGPVIVTKTATASANIVTETATSIVDFFATIGVGASVWGAFPSQAWPFDEKSSSKSHSHKSRATRKQRKTRELVCTGTGSSTASAAASTTAAASASLGSSVLSTMASVSATYLGGVVASSSAAASEDSGVESTSTDSGFLSTIASISATYLAQATSTPTSSTQASSIAAAESVQTSSASTEAASHLGAATSTASSQSASATETLCEGCYISVITITTCLPTEIYSTIPLVVETSKTSGVASASTFATTTAGMAQYTGAASSVKGEMWLVGLVGAAVLVL